MLFLTAVSAKKTRALARALAFAQGASHSVYGKAIEVMAPIINQHFDNISGALEGWLAHLPSSVQNARFKI